MELREIIKNKNSNIINDNEVNKLTINDNDIERLADWLQDKFDPNRTSRGFYCKVIKLIPKQTLMDMALATIKRDYLNNKGAYFNVICRKYLENSY